MLEIIQATGPVVAVQASGTLSAQDYDRLTQEIERQLRAHENISLFADFSGLEGMSLPAIAKDLQFAVGKLGELQRLARVAVVTDKPWLRAWTQLAWLLVPKASVRTFGPAEREDALAWSSELEAEPPQRALRVIETTRADTFAFAWDGTITVADADEVFEKLELALVSHSAVRVLARIERIGGIRLQALMRANLLRIKVLGLRKVERYALVGRASWLERYVELASHLTTIQVRYFSSEREQDAWAFLEAEPASELLPAGHSPEAAQA